MPYGERRAESIRKFTVASSIEKEVSKLLSTVSWGALLELRLDNNKVVEANVLSDWSADMPIFGLSATYKSITALCYSVYADRVFYDEDNHALIIDVLYICTESSAKYYQNAIKRDNDNHNNMEDIYDDEE